MHSYKLTDTLAVAGQISADMVAEIAAAGYQVLLNNRPDGEEKDPDNNLFWRFNMRRLTAEEIRDSVLSYRQTQPQDGRPQHLHRDATRSPRHRLPPPRRLG